MRRPIDYNFNRSKEEYPAGNFGLIISHIGSPTYRPKTNSRLVISQMAAGSIVTVTILMNNLRSKQICGDQLRIMNGDEVIKVCGDDSVSTFKLIVADQNKPRIVFRLLTNNDEYGGSLLLSYSGE